MNAKAKIIDMLKERRAEILQVLCERDDIYHRDIIFQLVSELRGTTKLIKLLEEPKE